MQIETEKIKFKNSTLPVVFKAQLTELQLQYLTQLENQSTIQEVIQSGLKNGWLVNFVQLYQLIQKLVAAELISNLSFYRYFSEIRGAIQPEASTESVATQKAADYKKDFKELIKLPFLRSLEPEMALNLLEESSIVDFPADALICKKGDVFSKNLFILLSGEAAIYGQGEHTKKFVTILKPKSVFGEMGFFLGVPRTADIVAVQKSKVLVISGDTEYMKQSTNSPQAEHLVHRFWIQQALLKSEIFKNIPTESFDELTFGGKVVHILEKQVLFTEGDQTNGAYIVLHGQFSVQIKSKMVAKISQGQMIGEISLFKTQGKRSATIIADKDSVLMHISLQKFYYLMSQNLYLAKTLQELSQQRFEKNKSTP